MNKTTVRREIGEKKRAMTAEQIEAKSAVLAHKLFDTAEYRRAKSIYAYLSFNQEVRTVPIIERAWADGKRIAVPKVVDGRMVFIWLTGFDQLAEGYSGIAEPVKNGPAARDETALVLVPGLAFDREGHRIGYGGGFYDRFLSAEPNHPTIALCYGFQIYDHLEVSERDVPVDLILSEDA